MTITDHSRRSMDVFAAKVRDDFPAVRDDEIYFDNAATSHKPRAVLDAVTSYYTEANANVGRGYHAIGHRSTQLFEDARATIARAIGALPDEISFTLNTTDSLNLLAGLLVEDSLGPGDEVIVSGAEHSSNLLPWHRACLRSGATLRHIRVEPASGQLDLEHYASLVGDRTRVVAVSHVNNVLGTVHPVRQMAELAHGVGAVVVVDGAQAAAHRKNRVDVLSADFYCFSAHKLYGPMGVGVLWGRFDLIKDMGPYRVGGGTVKGVDLSRPIDWVPVPARLEAGTPNVAGAVGAAAAIDYLDGLGWDAIASHDAGLVRRMVDRVTELDGFTVVGDPSADPYGIVSVVAEGIHPYDIGSHLDASHVAVRCGVHCASRFLDQLDLLGTVRLSLGIYNTVEEVDRVSEILATARPGEWTRDRPHTRFA